MKVHNEKAVEIWNAASDFLINELTINKNRKSLLLLSGGSVVNIYHQLSKFLNSKSSNLPFLSIALVDDRFHPDWTKQAQSLDVNINSHLIEKTGFWETCYKKKIHYYTISQEGTLAESARQYNKIINRLFSQYDYKIAVLGIGEDGHTAGLIPGYEKAWDTNNFVVGYENNGQFKQRITMTPKAIKELDQAIVLAKGKKKKRVVDILLNETVSLNKFPMGIIHKIPRVDLFLDFNRLLAL